MKKKTNKKHKDTWFIKVRGSYLPHNVIGWLTYIPFLAYLIFVGVIAVQEADSLLLATLFIIPNWAVATAVITYLATRHS